MPSSCRLPSRSWGLTVLAASLLLSAGAAQAEYPSKPIHVYVSSTAGGALDVFSRMIANRLSERMKQAIVIENRPGAAGNIATASVARAAPDGYTLLFAIDTTFTVNPSLYATLPFDPESDFATISVPVTYGQMLAVGNEVAVASLDDLMTQAKARPMTYGSGGTGSPSHLTFASLVAATGVPITHIPYKASGPAVVDTMSGHVDSIFAVTQALLPHVKAGKLKPLAVSGSVRSPLAPDVPTVAEAGYPAFQAEFAYALMAPAKTPPEIVERLHREIEAVMAMPEVQSQNQQWDYIATGLSPAASGDWLRTTRNQWASVIREAGIQTQD